MLTAKEIEQYHTQGYLVMRGLIQGRELKMLQEATESVIAAGMAAQGIGHEYQNHPSGKKVYWRTNNMWQHGDIFQAVTLNPDLLENIGQCIGQAFYPSDDALVVKLPGEGAPVPWHQDPPYGNPRYEETHPVPNFVADLYLDHSGPDNGCVWAIPGHHLVGHVDLANKTQDQLFEECGAVPVEMEAGDVMFHSLSIPHGSRATGPAATRRRIFYLHFLADEVFRDLYLPNWEKIHPGKPAGLDVAGELIKGMMTHRALMGLELPTERETLRLDENGITFVGQPKTPSGYWAELAKAIPTARRDAMKRLERSPVGAT